MLRVYLNRFEDAPLIWSVDEGTKATERRFKNVHFVDVTGKTCANLTADNVNEPRCWLEIEQGEIDSVVDGVAIISEYL